MSTLQDELDYLQETKVLIKEAIINKGQDITDQDSFRSYVNKIDNIETGIDTSDATATADDITKNKTAYVNGQKVTGNIRTIQAGLDEEANLKHINFNTPANKLEVSLISASPGSVVLKENQALTMWIPADDVASTIGLTANKIKKNESILGITGNYEGLDTSDATATAQDLIEGTTAYVNGEKIEGTLELTDSISINNSTNTDTSIILTNLGNIPVMAIDADITDFYGDKKVVEDGSTLEIIVSQAQIANNINLTANKIALGETILGVTGTYEGSAMKEYISVTDMNNDIANISEGEVVKVIENNITTFYLKETTMKKLVKEEDTISPEDYNDAIDIANDILGEEE